MGNKPLASKKIREIILKNYKGDEKSSNSSSCLRKGRMINWYRNSKLGIFFDKTPCVTMRYATPSMTKAEKKSVTKYPFINRCELKVVLEDYQKDKKYCFAIPKDYCWDGASIPRVFWQLIGAKTDSKFLVPSMIHDVLCEHHEYVDNDRYFADKIFERLLYISEVPAFNRWLMFHSVDNYQKFCGWGKNG